MKPRVCAHLIVGAQSEPFLGALLASLDGVAQTLIVNDNAPDPSPHAHAFGESSFAKGNALIVDRSPFKDFSTARNICLRLHAEHNAGEWVAFVDADEVHGSLARNVAANLGRVPSDIDFVDGYTWHFFQAPNLYTSIERRMMFFRFGPSVRWENPVHEQLRGLNGSRLALPYVYGHYGHVLSTRRHAEKGRRYSGLGQSGDIVDEDRLDTIDVEEYFKEFWPRLLRFKGEHARNAVPVIANLQNELHDQFARANDLVARYQGPLQRARNAVEALNYEQRWRLRALTPLARQLVRQKALSVAAGGT